eukprot:UN33003
METLAYFIYRGKIPFFLARRDTDINMAPVDLVGNLTMCSALDLIERRQKQITNVQVVNGSKILVNNVSFELLLSQTHKNWNKLIDVCVEHYPEIEVQKNPPRYPWFSESLWLFEFLYFIFVAIPIFFYTTWLGQNSEKSQYVRKLTSFCTNILKSYNPNR